MTTTPSRRQAPGPRGLPLVGNLIPFRRDALRLLLDSRRSYGDVVRFTLGPMVIHLLAHPEHVRQVLVTRQHNYDKDTRSSSVLRGLVGEGLLTASGDFWLRQRRLIQPVFQHQRLAGLVPVLTEATGAMLKHWQTPAGTGQPLDVASEMT